jgi:hypothetical protein
VRPGRHARGLALAQPAEARPDRRVICGGHERRRDDHVQSAVPFPHMMETRIRQARREPERGTAGNTNRQRLLLMAPGRGWQGPSRKGHSLDRSRAAA